MYVLFTLLFHFLLALYLYYQPSVFISILLVITPDAYFFVCFLNHFPFVLILSVLITLYIQPNFQPRSTEH